MPLLLKIGAHKKKIFSCLFFVGAHLPEWPTVMSIEIRQKKGQNRGVEWSKLTLRKCAVEGLNCHEVDKFEF